MVVIFWNHHHAIGAIEGTGITDFTRRQVVNAAATDPVLALFLVCLAVFFISWLTACPCDLLNFFFYPDLFVVLYK